ncbi:DUF1127 domain-containing protein [Sagittula sp. SSi028]|uniref:DUF1127 domain-containing protein n=1 Tax=Sagittula sp. SSi028 TaxID=3400636 RepID=UPI003AF87277
MLLSVSPVMHPSPRRSSQLWTRLTTWTETAHQRAMLRNLDATALRDMGIDPEAALAEARRPFWDTAAR